jgi:hypothetical protein
LLDALLFLPNWAFMEGDDGEGDPLRQAVAVTGEVDQLVADVLEGLSERERAERIAAAAARSSGGLARLEQALRAVAAVPVDRLPKLLLEVIDVYSHRLDAWITSLASRRLAELRASGADGVRFGCYGWVENLRPPVPREQIEIKLDDEVTTAIVSDQDGYMHAPSLQHAAAAAVLRSGFLGHPGEQTYAVNLSSRRARTARWLLGGVRQGQSLASLLGYRFERALHDAGLDTEVDNFRAKYPMPVVEQPDGPDGAAPVKDGLWARSMEAIAVRNLVDGMALARAGMGALEHAKNPDAVRPILADLADALDAVGDLVLAESVHQLVGGSPLRAGLTADTLGRGSDRAGHLAHAAHSAPRSRDDTAGRRSAAGRTGWPDTMGAGRGRRGRAGHRVLGRAPARSGGNMDPDRRAGPGSARRPGGGRPFELTIERLGPGALSTVLDAAVGP